MQFCSSGLLVQDDTDTLRRLLETLGGRRDAALNGWLFPFGYKYKIVIALRVGGYNDVVDVEDRAEVRLSLRALRSGVLVTGQTLPAQQFLQDQGGVWDCSHLGWFLEGFQKRQLRRKLWKCRAVEAIDEID